MTYAIVYDSRTGNTKRLAQAVAETLPADGRLAFGAYMDVSLVNDGPFTLWLDTASL